MSNVRLRRSKDRGFEDYGWVDNWITFSFADFRDPEWTRFGPLRVMVENHIQPRSGFPAHPHRNVEIVTYVSSGTLTHEDSFGHRAEIGPGEMQLISGGSRGMVHSEENRHDELEHNYQMWLVPDRPDTAFAYHQRGFTLAERRNRFRLYVSPDGREGSMPINTDALIYAGLFEGGSAAEHSLAEGRGAWVQVVQGKVEANGETLDAGDGMGITEAKAVSCRFLVDSEVLLFDVRMDVPVIWE